MKLRTKLFLSFGAVISLFLVVVAIYHLTLTGSIDKYENLSRIENSISGHANSAESLMLQCRRNEKDFIIRLDPKYVARHGETIQKLKGETAAIAKIGDDAGLEEYAQAARSIDECADEYATSFASLVAAYQRRGLNEKSGVQAQFRKAVHDLEELLNQCRLDDLHVDLLQCRRYEKDYIRTKAAKYHDKFLATVEDYHKHLSASSCAAEVKQTQEIALAEYVHAFENIVSLIESEASSQTGVSAATDTSTQMDALYEQMRNAAHTLESTICSAHIPDSGRVLLMVRRHEKDYLMRKTDKYVKRTNARIEELRTLCHSSGLSEEDLSQIDTLLDTYLAGFNALVAEDAKITEHTATMRAAVHKIEPLVAGISHDARTAAEECGVATSRHAASRALLSVWLSGAAVLMAIVLACWIVYSVTRSLNRIIDGLGTGAEQTVSAAVQVSSASQNLADGAGAQAAGIEQTSASMTEMAAQVKQNSDNARAAQEVARLTKLDTDAGAKSMTLMVKAIDDIKSASDDTAKIIKTIDEIAFQTNLLALNAAVEAARAGESGKGFAVVAEEVRSLAQRSAEAARSTAAMIQTAVKNAGDGVAICQEVGETIDKVTDGNLKVNDLISEIAEASSEQTEGIEQISQAIDQMDKITQSNASTAEESAAASEELSAQAEELNRMARQLRSVVHGNSDQPSRPQAGAGQNLSIDLSEPSVATTEPVPNTREQKFHALETADF